MWRRWGRIDEVSFDFRKLSMRERRSTPSRCLPQGGLVGLVDYPDDDDEDDDEDDDDRESKEEPLPPSKKSRLSS